MRTSGIRGTGVAACTGSGRCHLKLLALSSSWGTVAPLLGPCGWEWRGPAQQTLVPAPEPVAGTQQHPLRAASPRDGTVVTLSGQSLGCSCGLIGGEGRASTSASRIRPSPAWARLPGHAALGKAPRAAVRPGRGRSAKPRVLQGH